MIPIVSLPPPVAPVVAVVQRVVDGDTLKVSGLDGKSVTVRLCGIDAPESRQRGGLQSKQALSSLLPSGSLVAVDAINTDRYGRTVARLKTPEGVEVSEFMVTAGQALIYPSYVRACKFDNTSLFAAQGLAKSLQLGFWSLPAYDQVEPWEYRKNPHPVI